MPFFASCNNDDSIDTFAPAQGSNSHAKDPSTYPAHIGNHFDTAGLVYFDISEIYTGSYDVHYDSIERATQIVDSLALADPDFSSISGPNYQFANAFTVSSFLAGDEQMLDNVLLQSGLGTYSRKSLVTYVGALLEYQTQQKSYDVFYQYITNYESAILNNSAIPANDKRTILMVTSLTRYGFYLAYKQKQKPKDRTWDITMGCIIAGIHGSTQSMAKAIELFTASGVLANN